MGKAITPTLAEVLKSPDKEQYRAFILEKLQANPYSQPFQRLAQLLNEPSDYAIQRYDWHETLRASKPEENSPMISVGTIVLNKKSKAPNLTNSSLKKPLKTTETNREEKTTELSPFTKWILANTSTLADAAKAMDNSERTKTDELVIHKAELPQSAKVKKKAKKKKEKGIKTKSKKGKGKEISGKSKKGRKKAKKKSMLKEKIDSSIQKNEEIVTETLAKLYFEQGYYRKALAMYERLSLIYPQKSSSFAPFIADIKIKLK